jgi:hypothetical protein
MEGKRKYIALEEGGESTKNFFVLGGIKNIA